MLENDPESFLQLPAVDNIVQYASVACTMLHSEAQASALRLLSVLTDVADEEVDLPDTLPVGTLKGPISDAIWYTRMGFPAGTLRFLTVGTRWALRDFYSK